MHHPVFNRAFRLILLIGFIVLITGCSLFYKKIPAAPEEKPGTALDMVLSSLSLKRQDLGITCPIQQNDPFLLQKVPLFLNSPMQINSFAEYCEAELNKEPRSLSSLIILAAAIMELRIRKDPEKVEKAPCKEYAGLPEPLREAVEDISSSLLNANALFAESFKELTPEEKHFITKRFAGLLFSKEQDVQLTRRQEQDLNEKALSLAGRVNRQKMIEAALMVSEAIDRALTILSAENISLLRPEFTRKQITINTAAGEVIIGGFGSNRYNCNMPALLIDVGGDDVYCFTSYNPQSVIIDVSGNDTYASAGSAAYGAGIMGMGFLVDQAGDDRYSSQNSSLGTGYFGAGVLLDKQGDDVYSGQMLTQGAGAFGLGSCVTGRELISTRALRIARDLVLPAGAGCSLTTQAMIRFYRVAGLQISGKKPAPTRPALRDLARAFAVLLQAESEFSITDRVMIVMREAISVRVPATGSPLGCLLTTRGMIPIRRAGTRRVPAFTQALVHCLTAREMTATHHGRFHRVAAMTALSACSGTSRGMTATALNGFPREAVMMLAGAFLLMNREMIPMLPGHRERRGAVSLMCAETR